MSNYSFLVKLGWQPYFQQQLNVDEWNELSIARVVAQHRSTINILDENGETTIPVSSGMPSLTVGDWITLDCEGRFSRLLDRSSLFSRKAAGSKVQAQLIAANIDTLFVVSSMNQDFNLNRIERYIAMAREANVEVVVVLTKMDCCDDAENYSQQAQQLDSLMMVVPVNALDLDSVNDLKPWCCEGKTVALLGSSGVGKSTLVNSLLANTLSDGEEQATGGIRDDDSKGRHTTTGRSIHQLASGGLLLDTPGMRELQLSDCESGVNETFADITALAQDCKFTDCQHESEPGCAVQKAIAEGALDTRRLQNFAKLMREQFINSATLAEKRDRDRNLSRHYRSVQTEARKRKKN